MKRRWSLFTYPVMDLKAAEAMLCRRAEEGWRLEKVWLGIVASFVPAEEPVTYCIDWTDACKDDGRDYLALLSEAGWRQAAKLDYGRVYEAPAGTAPIQTDSALEYERFCRKPLRRIIFGFVALTAIFLVYFLLMGALASIPAGDPTFWREIAVYTAGGPAFIAFLLFTALPMLLLGLLWQGRMLLRLIQWRRAVRDGEPTPVPGRWSAMAAAVCCLLVKIWSAMIMALLLLDCATGAIGLTYLGTAIGASIGSGLVFLIYTAPEYEPHRRNSKRMLILVAVGVLLALLPDGWTAGLRVADPMADRSLLAEPEWRVVHKEQSSVVAAYTKWDEEDTAGRWLRARAWTTRWPWLADWMEDRLRWPGMDPVQGHEDVWTSGETWLIRQGDTVLLVESPDELGEAWLDETAAWMEGAP